MLLIYWVLTGLCLGSFANVCIYRLPREESLVRPRSRCPRCRTPLPWRWNVPLVSYIFLRGKCGACRTDISPIYPLVEAVMGGLFLLLYWRHGPAPALLLVGGVLTFHLFTLSIIDYQHKIIPNIFSVGLVLWGWLMSPFNPLLGEAVLWRMLHSFGGACLGLGIMYGMAALGEAVWKREALGGGDIKLMAGVGAVLGWKGVFLTLFIGSLLGAVTALALMALRVVNRVTYIPFGPFLSIGAWSYWLFPNLFQAVVGAFWE